MLFMLAPPPAVLLPKMDALDGVEEDVDDEEEVEVDVPAFEVDDDEVDDVADEEAKALDTP